MGKRPSQEPRGGPAKSPAWVAHEPPGTESRPALFPEQEILIQVSTMQSILQPVTGP